MKTWLAKFRISAALDSNRPLPPSLRQRIAASDELGRYAARCDALQRALKDSRPQPRAPAALHGAIMRAVRATHSASPPPLRTSWLRWTRPVAACGLCSALVLAGAWWMLHRPAQRPLAVAQALEVPQVALDWGGSISRATPAALVGPLADELQRLNRDLDRTAQFLLASLP